MNNKEINIRSSTIEKGLELAKEFLGKLISPTIEEVGLLISENIKFFRFKNQVKILLKAKDYADKNGIEIKEIPIKILVPLLENASLEENDELQNKWAAMIANMSDSKKTFQNHIFPFLLGQISIDEFNELKWIYDQEREHKKNNENYLILKEEEENLDKTDKNYLYKIDKQIQNIEEYGYKLGLNQLELANLQRLALIKQLPPRVIADKVKVLKKLAQKVNVKYDIDSQGYRLTELGSELILVCQI